MKLNLTQTKPIKAPHAGVCALCATPIYFEDLIYTENKPDYTVAYHAECVDKLRKDVA